jgi:hypothetical protein
MPTFLQASMSSEPLGAVIFFPSTVKFTSAIFYDFRLAGTLR